MTSKAGRRPMRRLVRVLCALVSLAALGTLGCASAITSVEATPGGTYILTGQSQQFGGLRGFVWEGNYNPATRVFTITRKTIAGP